MNTVIPPLTIDEQIKRDTRILFVAKNALWDGTGRPEDGNHACYHREMRQVLESLDLNLTITDNFDILLGNPDFDFVFPLLNRANFFNSEMLCPLLCERAGIPYLGASPILRGLADDKHLAKRACVDAGVPTAPWQIYRKGAPVTDEGLPQGERFVVKPNASSASWGLTEGHDWSSVKQGIEAVHELGHDAIVEPFVKGSDVEVPVVTLHDDPLLMPMLIFRQADPEHLRKYEEKRDLVDRSQKYSLDDYNEPDNPIVETVDAYTRKLWGEYRPFDYGRFEFRVNEQTGEVTFLEVNLNCNLWSQKVFGRSATMLGWTQQQLIETILAESLRRNGLMG